MEKLYHLIQVYGYKGGELVTQLNLDYEDLILTLSEFFIESYVDNKIDLDLGDSEMLNVLKEDSDNGKVLKYIFDNSSSYAGSEDWVWRLYYTEDNKMIRLPLTQNIIDDVVKSFIMANI